MTPVTDSGPSPVRFAFPFEGLWRWGVLPWGVTPSRAWAEVDDREVRVRFGPWHVEIPLANVRRFEIQPPYRWWRAIGVRTTFRRWDVSFCSSTRGGVYLEFERPMRWWSFGHPGFTLTLADPDAFAAELRTYGISGDDLRAH
jgi:hypothetical protein